MFWQQVLFEKRPAGPFKEVDGSTLPPSYFQAYVTSMPLTFGIIIPVVALVYMVWQHDNDLAICTLGAYLVEVVAQLVSEGVYIKQGEDAEHVQIANVSTCDVPYCRCLPAMQRVSCGPKCPKFIKLIESGSLYEAAILPELWAVMSGCGPCKQVSSCCGFSILVW